MKKQILFLSILSSLFLLGNAKSTPTEAKLAKAANEINMSGQQLFKNVWNNDGVVSTSYFSYEVGCGTLTTSGTPNYRSMAKAEGEGNFANGSGARVFENGSYLGSSNDNRVMIKVTALAEMNLSFSVSADPAGWMDAGDGVKMNYFVISGDVKDTWYTGSELVKTVSMINGTTKKEDLSFSTTLKSGDNFILEYGRQWEGERTYQWFGPCSSFSFSQIEKASETTLYYSKMVGEVSNNSGEDVTSTAPFMSYGFYHGNLSNGEINSFENVSNNKLASDNVTIENWQVSFCKNDRAIIKFVASEYMVFKMNREVKGGEFLMNSDLRVYLNNKKIYDVKFTSEPAAEEIAFSMVASQGDIIYVEFGFQWDDTRSMKMLTGGDILTSLPKFSGYGLTYSQYLKDAQDFAKTYKDIIVCYNGEKTPEINGMEWSNIKESYSSLSDEAKLILKFANFSVDGDTVLSDDDTDLDVAAFMAKYDQLVIKYAFEDFIGRAPKANTSLSKQFNILNSDSLVLLTVAISLTALICLAFVAKKKLHR